MTLDLPVAGISVFQRYDAGRNDIIETATVLAVKVQHHEGKVHHWTATLIGASGIAKVDSHFRPVNKFDWHPPTWKHSETTNKLVTPLPAPQEATPADEPLPPDPLFVLVQELRAEIEHLKAAKAPVEPPAEPFVPAVEEPAAVEPIKAVGRPAKVR